jgi:hypothetical protein
VSDGEATTHEAYRSGGAWRTLCEVPFQGNRLLSVVWGGGVPECKKCLQRRRHVDALVLRTGKSPGACWNAIYEEGSYERALTRLKY